MRLVKTIDRYLHRMVKIEDIRLSSQIGHGLMTDRRDDAIAGPSWRQ